ncbi:unnamed protein product, partial [Amoebophrya sp. A25]
DARPGVAVPHEAGPRCPPTTSLINNCSSTLNSSSSCSSSRSGPIHVLYQRQLPGDSVSVEEEHSARVTGSPSMLNNNYYFSTTSTDEPEELQHRVGHHERSSRSKLQLQQNLRGRGEGQGQGQQQQRQQAVSYMEDP